VAGVVDKEAVGEGVDVSDISGFKSSICMLATMPWCDSILVPSRLGDTLMSFAAAWPGRSIGLM
jgi:hypothetical protein